MKKFYPIVLLFLLGCLSEENLEPGNPQVFLKYYNGGFDDEARDFKRTSDGGFILLATTTVRASDVAEARYKIKLIKVDEFGTPQWTNVYPRFDDPIDSVSFRGNSIQVLKDQTGNDTGYVVVGDSIQRGAGSQSHLRIMVTDLFGVILTKRNFSPGFGVSGTAVAITSTGNFVVLGSATNSAEPEDMFVAELDQNLATVWSRSHGAGFSALSNRLYTDAQSNIFWAGTVLKSNRSNIRIVKTPPDSENTEFDLTLGPPDSNETGEDFCRVGSGFAVVGTTDEFGDEDILFKRLSQNGDELSTHLFGEPSRAENGLAICQSSDGGFILVGSTESTAGSGRGGTDYYMIKLNAFGTGGKDAGGNDLPFIWERIFGSKSDDIPSAVMSLSDGSIVVYGTTVWGGLRTLSLIKANKEGKLE